MQDNDVTNEPADLSSEAMQAISSKMDEVFSKADADDKAEIDLAAVVSPKPTESVKPSAQEVSRQRASKKEQQEELDEEGLTDPNNPEGKPASKEQPKGEEGEEVPVDGEEPQPEAETPELDPSLRQVAEEFGWKAEQIDRLLKADPELAQQTFERMADAYTNLSRQIMAAGSPEAPGTQPVVTTAAQPETAPASTPLDKLLSPEALAAFAETNGEEIVEKFLKPFASERQAMRQQLTEMQAYVAVQERKVVAQEASLTLSDLRQKNSDLYGKDDGNATADQQQTLKNLAQTADQLRAGAKQQGREMSVKDALKRAHLILSADKRVADGRKQVIEQVQKRNKQITARTTQRRSKLVTAKSDDSAAEAVARFWQERGIDD